MTNIEAKFDKDTKKLMLLIDCTKRLGRSKSGKTTIIATTSGNQPVPGAEGIVMGVNVYTKEA